MIRLKDLLPEDKISLMYKSNIFKAGRKVKSSSELSNLFDKHGIPFTWDKDGSVLLKSKDDVKKAKKALSSSSIKIKYIK